MTIPSFATYQPPAVYVQDVSSPIIAPSVLPSQVLTLVGPALGYRTAVQSLLISSVTPVPLTYDGVYVTGQSGPPAIAAPVVTTLGGIVLTAGVDYTLTVTNDPSGNPALAVTTISRVSNSPNVSDGQQVTITYNYTDGGYYQPQLFSDYPSVVNSYGQAFVSSVPSAPNASQVANPLTAAALVAFGNGATSLVCVALNPGDGTLEDQFKAAYAKVASNPACSIVVPVFTDDLSPSSGTVAALAATLANDLNSAMWAAYNDGFPRRGFFGLPRNYSEADESPQVFASNLASRRVTLVYPEVLYLFNTATSQTFQCSGCYLAVALGAILSSLPVSTGLTNQVIRGFAGLTQTEMSAMTNAFMNSLAAAGVTVCYMDRSLTYAGTLTCRQGLTTDMSAINFREISMVRQSDSLLLAIRQGLSGSGLIGQPITANTVTLVSEAVIGILEAAVANQVIQGYINLVVQQQTYPRGSPTVIAVSFQYQPAEPLNYIPVTMAVDLSSGLVAVQSQQNASATGA